MNDKVSMRINMIIESINYIIISYALSNMALFFHSSLFYILFFASEIWLTGEYWKSTLNEIKSKSLTALLVICCFCIHIGMVYFSIYISGTLTHFELF